MQIFKLCALLCALVSVRALTLQESKIRTDKHARIAGGVAASNGDFPYLAAIYSISGGNYYCAGALLSKRYVLTAGHCMIDEASNIKVVVGRNDLSNTTGREVTVLQKILHTNYNDANLQNDLALLQLSEDILEDTSANIQYADVASTPPQVGTYLWAAAWGAHPSSEAYSTIAYKVQVQVRAEKAPCSGQPPYNYCAGNGDGKDTCEGDSGSSIVYRADNTSRWTTYGITSYGTGESCGVAGATGAYTNVSMYYDWILANMVNVTSTTVSPTTTAVVTTTSTPTTTVVATTSTPVMTTTGAVTTTKVPTTTGEPVVTTQTPAMPTTTKALTTSTAVPTTTMLTTTVASTSTLPMSTTTSSPATTTPTVTQILTSRVPTATSMPTVIPTSTKPTINSANSTSASRLLLAIFIVILM